MRNYTFYSFQPIDHISLCLCFCFSEDVINRIIALTKEQGDAIEDKVSIHSYSHFHINLRKTSISETLSYTQVEVFLSLTGCLHSVNY